MVPSKNVRHLMDGGDESRSTSRVDGGDPADIAVWRAMLALQDRFRIATSAPVPVHGADAELYAGGVRSSSATRPGSNGIEDVETSALVGLGRPRRSPVPSTRRHRLASRSLLTTGRARPRASSQHRLR